MLTDMSSKNGDAPADEARGGGTDARGSGLLAPCTLIISDGAGFVKPGAGQGGDR